MNQVINHLEDPVEIALKWHDEGREVALATVIATWGSSPLPVGSQLVVDDRGVFKGSVSGGCIEGAVITEALGVIRDGQPKQLSFGVSNEQAWDVGLACGGDIDIYVEKLEQNHHLYKEAMNLKRANIPSSLVTELSSGDKILVPANDRTSLKKLPADLQQAASEAFRKDTSLLVRSVGKSFFIHILNPDPQLIIIGAVHIAGPLAHMARLAGYTVMIIDPRTAFASKERFPDIELNTAWPDEAMEKMSLHPRTAVVAMTHDPKIDDPALKTALCSDVFYIGALGSHKTHASRTERLKSEGFTEKQIGRIHGPIGLDINAKTPAEIAVAILAQITAERRKNNLTHI